MMRGGDLRLFTSVLRIYDDGGLRVRRLDGRGELIIPAKEAAKAGETLQAGDVVEVRVWPGGKAGDALLVRFGRVLAAVS